jgi:MinD-like ATPase involved in chromosome partitioning or flagellar assembly
MIALVVAPGAEGSRIAEELRDEGVDVPFVGEPHELGAAGDPTSPLAARLAQADSLVLAAPGALSAEIVAECDRLGVRIVLLADRPADARAARAFGLAEPLPVDAPGWRIAAAVAGPRLAAGDAGTEAGRIVVVWGPEGAPGRTRLAIELALETARSGAHVALVDADTRAPSVAIALGLADESPGFAAACRQAEFGMLDAGELLRVSVPLGDPDGRADVLTGINRASRWPELSAPRVGAALRTMREWADVVIVDVASSLETDEEIVSDLDGPRRNAATLAALQAADQVVAVGAADPVGLARLVRGHAELRQVVGTTPVRVVINRLRSGPVGIDARGQVRRALDRFAGVSEAFFLPDDRRAADAAILAARPVGEVAPRSALAQAVRRLSAELRPREPRAVRGDRRAARDAARAPSRLRRRTARAAAAGPGAVAGDA